MRIGVVGAGLAGLTAARRLAGAGLEVVVVDKAVVPGGRMATDQLGGAVFDHGAQFFTVRSPEFAGSVGQWAASGWVTEWCRGFSTEDGFPRWTAVGGMGALALRLAEGLDVRCSTMAFAVRRVDGGPGWDLGFDDGSFLRCDGLVITLPITQAIALLITSGVSLPAELAAVDYDRTIALLAALDGPGGVPPPGGLQHPDDTFSFVADNRAKGLCEMGAITFHANSEWSLRHWHLDHEALAERLADAGRRWLGDSAIVERRVVKWRFATPSTTWPDPCWFVADPAPLALAGDAFAGPRVEGAVLSGAAAARALLQLREASL